MVLLFGLGGWIGQLLSVQGHVHEPLVEPSLRPGQTVAAPGTVEPLRPGTAGYRFNLPEKVHPISSGVKGGLVGGLLMPIPAMAYGMIAHGSPWLPINLLVGIVIPGITGASLDELKEFHLVALILGIVIHAAFSVTFGLMYGVILPMLPSIRGGPLLFGGVLMPISVDRRLLRHDGRRQSAAGTARELAVVYRLAVGVRPGHVVCGVPLGKDRGGAAAQVTR